MPGTIQVSIIEVAVDDLLSQISPNIIKVSLGNSEFQTCKKGEVIFPLKSMRDNLIVTVLDKEGTNVSSAGVNTRLVIEKGVWDEVLFLEGGCQVHLKLQFVLSNEDREKIRTMRQSVLTKKREEYLKKQFSTSKIPDVAAISEGSPDEEKLYRVVESGNSEMLEQSEGNTMANYLAGTKDESAKCDRQSPCQEKTFMETERTLHSVTNHGKMSEKFDEHESICSASEFLSEPKNDTPVIEIVNTDSNVFHGVWIFPEERPLCATTSKSRLRTTRGFEVDPELQPKSLQDSCATSRWRKHGRGYWSDKETPSGWIGQVVKVVIVVGFAVQIALNRR